MKEGQAILQFERGMLRGSGQELPTELRIAAGQTIRQSLEGLEFRLPLAAVALLNGSVCDLDTVIRDGDTIRILAQISGG
jgi:sulfur carrier protein ThiS